MKILKKIIKTLIFMFKQKKVIQIPKIVNNKRLLEGRIALITGGSSGIGLAIADEFLKNGCKVIITGTNEEKLRKCYEKLGKENVRYMVLNLLETKQIKKIFEEILDFFPEEKIDILVNSAGIVGMTDYLNVTEEEYDNIMDINLKGTFFISQIFSKYMIENSIEGNILNISSSSALRPAWRPYQISKWGIKGFTLGLADILSPYGITVNAIAPGPVATPMLGKFENENIYNSEIYNKRYALPREIAYLATYLVSDLGKLIKGDTMYSTGGSGILNFYQ